MRAGPLLIAVTQEGERKYIATNGKPDASIEYGKGA